MSDKSASGSVQKIHRLPQYLCHMRQPEKDSGKTRIRKDITAKSPTQTPILSCEAPAISVLDKGLFTYRCMNLGVGLGYAVLGQG